MITYNRGVREFIRKLNELSGKSYRLPYEAEWLYGIVSGQKEEPITGTGVRKDDYRVCTDGISRPVKSITNGLGIHEMHAAFFGAFQWCHYQYDAEFYKNNPEKSANVTLTGPIISVCGRYIPRGMSHFFRLVLPVDE